MDIIKSNAVNIATLVLAVLITLTLVFSGGCDSPVTTETDVEITDTTVEDTTDAASDVTEDACVEADTTDGDTDSEDTKVTCPQIVIVD